jgi:hypothetical protein
MQSIKLSSETVAAETIEGLQSAMAAIEAGNAASATAEKAVKRGKQYIADKLRELRGIDVSALPISSVVAVSVDNQPLLNVVIGKQNRLDMAKIEAEFPDVDRFKRDFPTVSYKRAI